MVIAIVLVHSSACTNASWKLLRSDSLSDGVPIESLTFTGNEQGWALTPGELLKLSGKGSNWTTILSNPTAERAFYSFAFTSTRNGIIVGMQKKDGTYTVLILQTSDGGESWQERPTNVKGEPDIHKTPALVSVSFCGEKSGWAVGKDLILHTSDGGQTWQPQRSKSNGDDRLITVACSSPERAWAVGLNGLVLRTSDGGNTWTDQDVGTKDLLMRVRFFGDSGWIVGGTQGKAVLLRTHDGGETWQPQPVNISEGLFDIFFIGTHGWIAGEKGTILRSDDGGQMWSQQKTPTMENLTCLFFLSPNEGWAGGDKRTLLRYSN